MTDKTALPHYHPLFRPLCRIGFRLASDVRIFGRENFPKAPYIAISNHLSFFDPLAHSLVTPDDMPALTAKKYRDRLMGRLITYFAAAIWIEQDSPDREAIREALAHLKKGGALAIAPEGHRSRDGQMQQAYEGAAFIIRKAAVPIVPMAITGTQRILKSLRPRVEIRVGKAFCLPENSRPSREQLQEDTERMMCSLAAMLPESYQGFYRGHPMIQEFL